MPDFSRIARQAAAAGGRVLIDRGGELGAVRTKTSATDFVTEADVAAGVASVRAIVEACPDARIVVEEPEVCEIVGIRPGTIQDPEVWLVDPLDGTTSYVHGFPCYSVSVAFVRDRQPVAGAVFNAALGEMFWAAEGEGAYREDERIRCSEAASVSDALVVTGFPYDRGAPLDRQLAVLAAFLRNPVHGVRRDGSAAIDCCHVAAGRADGFWEYSLNPWDMAAGVVICREAGAVVTDADGEPWTTGSPSICAAGTRLHAAMLEVIRSAS